MKEHKKVRLANGIEVNRMCASCENRVFNFPFRKCKIMDSDVPSDFSCVRWRVGKRFLKMEPGSGYVKTKEYLAFAYEIALENDQKGTVVKVDAEEMRKLYSLSRGKKIVLF